ncbi:hypothetical protein [Mucisphaera calidilacus]|uniref:Uncharacterized protein n=1 Tax=Mucisphaera calidilacus TaxID=2527982 RepID=A0A518BU42_9BACT|nr:hypothetical protein [Mucisphaera calidilacus]QDU70508.1 hypothetical protein Pan265_03360 [Mucisphaera calidilacus]
MDVERTDNPSLSAPHDRRLPGEIESSLEPWREVYQRQRSVARIVRTSVVPLLALPLAAVPSDPLVGVLLIVIVVTFWIAWCLLASRRRPCAAEVAERVDAQAETHNLLASALQFEREGSFQLFERATVARGLETLVCLSDFRLRPKPLKVPWRFGLGALALTLVLLALPSRVPEGVSSSAAVDTSGAVVVAGESALPRAGLDPVRSARQAAEPSVASGTRRDRGSSSVMSADERAEASSSGVGRTGGSGAHSSARPSSSTGSPDPSAPGSRRAADRQQERSSSASSRERRPAAGSASAGAAASGGGQSKGSSFGVTHAWKNGIRTTPGDVSALDDADSGEEDQDPDQDQQQRGGTQPSARDRNVAPSRQLGISGPKGPPGAGRGGPTPVKKSRGTSAMLLGVPTPELVEGQARPGPVKRTYRQAKAAPLDPSRVDPASMAVTEGPEDSPGKPPLERETRFMLEYLEALRASSGL